MPADTFHRLHAQTPTRFWVNNPSPSETEKALAAGAINCTTNPAFCAKLLQSDPAYLRGVIDDVVRDTKDHDEAAAVTYRRVSQHLLHAFRPLYDRSGGQCGFVTMQDDPRADHDARATIAAALRNRQLGPNLMAKIPVIAGGIEAIEACVEENIPICATEIFAIAQAIDICERYEAAARRTGNRPPFFVTHISGIFDEYLGKVAQREGIAIQPEVLDQAGCAIARKEYRLLRERGYPGILLGGGARGIHHFTEMVGGAMHVTINWSTAEEIMRDGFEVASRMEVETPPEVVAELCEKFPDFRRAYEEDGLSLVEYAGFGPVQLFRNAFLKGWYQLLAEIASRRHAHAV
jgi:transaldolase